MRFNDHTKLIKIIDSPIDINLYIRHKIDRVYTNSESNLLIPYVFHVIFNQIFIRGDWNHKFIGKIVKYWQYVPKYIIGNQIIFLNKIVKYAI